MTPVPVNIAIHPVYGMSSLPKRRNMNVEAAFENITIKRQVDALT